jgi:single-stranded-DNA-specific exonuclease
MILEKQQDKQLDQKKIRQLSNKFNISSSIIKLMLLRGVNTESKIQNFLHPSIDDINDPFLLKDMDKVVNKINKAIQNKKNIVIFGDYDVDGMSATSILYLYLKDQGVKVDYFLPNRYEDDYGVTKNSIDKIKDKFNPDLIITVDCGITAVEPVEYAKNLGIGIIITDHHEVPEITPNCLIINPKIKDQKYPFTDLCGAGVALKVVHALGGINAVNKYIDIAAIATIADIVSLTNENRAIVKLGIDKIKAKPREGLRIIFKQLKLSENTFTSVDIAFKVAPKINASGRMGEAETGLKLFITKDKRKLTNISKRLLDLNIKRQELCQLVYEQAREKLEKVDVINKKIIILSDIRWDSGLLGIVAARLAGEFNKPTILFSQVEGRHKGSARSIDGINIHKALSCVKTSLEAFGGHTMAAGLTVIDKNYNTFKQQLEDCVDELFDDTYFYPKKYYDLDLTVNQASLNFVKELNLLAPFGHKNPLPIFNLFFKNARVACMKRFKEHLTVNFNNNFGLLHFNGSDDLTNYSYFKNKNAPLQMQINTFRNKESLRGIVKAIKFSNINIKAVSSFSKGNYLKQLTYETLNKDVSYNTYNTNEFEQLVKQKVNQNILGTLVVFYDSNNYQKYLPVLKQLNMQAHLFTVQDKLGINGTLLGLSTFKNLNKFKNIIFAENVLSKSFLENLTNNTNANIYLPSVNYNKKDFKISLTRKTFSLYFNVFRQASKHKLNSENIYFYFNNLKSLNNNISNFNFMQFITCLKVFVDLNIIVENETQFNYYLKINKNVKSNLENSKLYNKLKSK